MGLPSKRRKKFLSHKKKWDKTTIVEEKELVKNYALKNKKEIRKLELLVKKYKNIAKQLNRLDNPNESEQGIAFLNRLKEQGILQPEVDSIDSVLDITVIDFLERRLSNIVYKLKLAKTPEQARQFVVHKHIMIGDKVINSPSYMTSVAEVEQIKFKETSSLFDTEHPERVLEKTQVYEEEVVLVEENTIENVEESTKLVDKEQDMNPDEIQEEEEDK
ncbi:MAG: 30S ribosomal protein S4 [Candidatus Nanoarchaeia archaeon]